MSLFPFPHSASALTSVEGITKLLQPEKHMLMVKVCPVTEPQELNSASGLCRMGLCGDGSPQWPVSGFGTLILPKHDFWGPVVTGALQGFSVSCQGSESDPQALLSLLLLLPNWQTATQEII